MVVTLLFFVLLFCSCNVIDCRVKSFKTTCVPLSTIVLFLVLSSFKNASDLGHFGEKRESWIARTCVWGGSALCQVLVSLFTLLDILVLYQDLSALCPKRYLSTSWSFWTRTGQPPQLSGVLQISQSRLICLLVASINATVWRFAASYCFVNCSRVCSPNSHLPMGLELFILKTGSVSDEGFVFAAPNMLFFTRFFSLFLCVLLFIFWFVSPLAALRFSHTHTKFTLHAAKQNASKLAFEEVTF